MKVASVILDVPTQALDAPYTYAVPEAAAGEREVEVGCAVVVPLGPRQAVGFVVGLAECPPDDIPGGLDPARLKPVKQAVSPPYFDEEGAACAQWLAGRYMAPLSACVRLFTPPGGVPRMVRGAHGHWKLEQPKVGEVDDRWLSLGPGAEGFVPRKNAVKQAQVIEALSEGELRAAELAAQLGDVSGTVRSLAGKGVVRVERRRRMRGAARRGGDEPFEPSPKPRLTEGQREALGAIGDACARGDGSVVLVDGVTGSGKTEVYLQAIEGVLSRGRTACVLVPEISLTPQTVARFRGRFGDVVSVMHSRMSDGERYDQWDFVRSGAARVVVGARSALFAPLSDVGLIVVDEEHEGTYKQDSAPRYHAREVAVWMARRSGAAVVLGSATPSIEALHAAAKDPSWTQVRLPQRANGRPMPQIEVVDMAREFAGGSRSMFSKRLAGALEEELSAGRKAVMLLNQRGFAQFVLCRDCGFVPECPECETALTYHERGNFLACHHCGHRRPAPPRCPRCSSPYLKKFGAGTQRVEDELTALVAGFPQVPAGLPVIRMDADTTRAKGAHARLLGRFAEAPSAILLGTQMIAKGLDFDDVTLVGVINADTQLNLPEYRAAERTFDLIEQVAGRAGRGALEGRVIVQTYRADAPAIRAAASYDRALFLRDELPKRKALGYPPYARLVNVLVWGDDEGEVRRGAEELHDALEGLLRGSGGPGWQVLAATPCVLPKLRGTHRWHVLVKAPADADVGRALLPFFRSRKAARGFSVAADVDPMSML